MMMDLHTGMIYLINQIFQLRLLEILLLYKLKQNAITANMISQTELITGPTGPTCATGSNGIDGATGATGVTGNRGEAFHVWNSCLTDTAFKKL